MPKYPPVKNTSGEGFSVEDQLVGLLVCHLLTGIPWNGAGDGVIRSIECQMKQDGWIFDDVVLTIYAGSSESRCACSVKSFSVFTKSGAPRDFARILWQQWLDRETFRQGRDSLALVSAQHDPEVGEAWFGLTETARAMTPRTMSERYLSGSEPSPLRKAAFDSLRLGDELDGRADDPVEVVSLLRSFRLAQHDFHRVDSQSATQATALCQQILREDARHRAGEFWEAVIGFAGTARRKGGRISLPDVLAKFAHRFPLKQHPDYAPDWAQLLTESRERMAALPMRIGGTVLVPRPELIEQMERSQATTRNFAVLGASGNGKSVLTCEWARMGDSEAIWLRAGDLAVAGGLRALFRLSRSIPELFANTSSRMRLVLDGLDKCYAETAFDEAAMILRATSAQEASERWETVISCCPEDWERVRAQLLRRGVASPGKVINVERFAEAQVRAACKSLPALRLLAQRPHLLPVLCWPKALDIVATYWQVSEAPHLLATESDFARWFWRSAITHDGPASTRDLVLRKLAVQLADRMVLSELIDTQSPEERAILSDLAREGLLQIDPIRREVRFAHELIADWARQRELQVQDGHAAEFLKSRLHSPFWHRAVRYHGLDLLEHDDGAVAWHEFFAAFGDRSAADEMAKNLLLEGPIFASDQRAILELLWPVLRLDKGALIRQFLRQFLRVATTPDEDVLARFASRGADLQLHASVTYRQPWAPYWLGVLRVLAMHADDVTSFAQGEVAEVCLLWLRFHGHIRVGMKEAAELALVSAAKVYRNEDEWHGRHSKTSPAEKACQALLAAAPEMPDEVCHLALKFSGRRPPDPDDGSIGDEPHLHPSQVIRSQGPLAPWPEGPQRRCARVFRNAFMDGNYSGPLFRTSPEVGAEIMFAVLLSLPRENWSPHDFSHELDQHGFASDFPRDSCFWTSGPFLTFLRINPSVALSAIVRLVNFATDRASELGEDVRERLVVPVSVNGEVREWRGHQFSHVWHQGHVFAPRAVGCALLSVEKWFYLLMEESQPVDEHLVAILNESRSIALGGLLICIGKKQPELFLGALRPMVEAIDFFWLEDSLGRRGEGDFSASSFHERSALLVEAWREWVNMPHRKASFHDLVMRSFLGDSRWQELVGECRKTWQARLDAATAENPAPPWLARIASEFDPANWRVEKQDERTLLIYDPPSNLPQPTEEDLRRLKRFHLLSQVPFQCQQILEGAQCSEEQMAELWSQLQEVRSLQVPTEEIGIRDNEDALCGIVAVAVVRHRQWLAADRERENEAFAILAEVGAQQPRRFWLVEDDFTDFKWDIFAAWALTTLWCEQPTEPFLLQAVGALVLWDRYLVVSRVMEIAATRRTELGDYFDRLFAHTIRYASARHQARIERHVAKPTFDRDTWVATHLEKFMSGLTEPLPADWTLLAPSREGHRGRRPTNGLDIGHIHAALKWAEEVDTARDEVERETWLSYHRQSFLCTLVRIRALAVAQRSPEPWYDHQKNWPYENERRLVERISRIVARLRPSEDHRRFWEPLFCIGLYAIRWIDVFVGRWMIEAGYGEEIAPAFIAQWREILEYAEDAKGTPAWKPGTGTHRGDFREVWKELLGLSRASPDWWDERLAPAVEAVREFYERWADRNVGESHSACTYIQFLKTRAARRLRCDGLLRLHRSGKIEDAYFWREQEVCDSFASFLRLLLDENWEELKASAETREAFMAFALKLAALQHPMGSEVLSIAGNRFCSIA